MDVKKDIRENYEILMLLKFNRTNKIYYIFYNEFFFSNDYYL